MIFESENRIRVINKYGLDTIMQLNFSTPDTNPVTIKSVCQMDHFDYKIPDEKHAILDQNPIEQSKGLERLVRTS
jgi:hypothetical protein